jgi:lysophospholipase L1-like esterase
VQQTRIPALATFFVLTAIAQTTIDTKNWTAADDHRNMMQQLGIRALRPGPSGNESAPNHANYDEAAANPFPDYPELLRLKSTGAAVTTPDMWWKQRRPEIIEDFDREVLGRVPANVPKVTWTVKRTIPDKVGPYPVIAKELVGHVEEPGNPITVDIELVVVTPAWTANARVPAMILFGRAAFPSSPLPANMARFAAMMASNIDPPSTQQIIASGWGYAALNPGSIQADNGAGLTKGIIGLVNKGQPRKPDDWGALRAWAWGASRALDYLETDAHIDARHVGIEGVSRYGKAALVTMAYDQRFHVVLIGSSGEGGAKPHRRNFGEAVENLTGSGEYHWMAGNFLKYGAADATFGSKNAGDIPVDSHQLIALCAPRLTFVSYGIPEKGDARWLDQQGSFMATVAAGSVFRLLGVKDLGVTTDYRQAKMPPVNAGLLDGRLAWRQHDGGHTDLQNWKFFLPWVNKAIGYKVPPVTPPLPANVAVPRMDANSITAHGQLIDKIKKGKIDVYFIGDSITRRWGALDYPDFLANWKQNFHGWNAANFGWGADRTQNILWRLEHGELDNVNPKVVVLQAGTNNLPNGGQAEDIAKGLEAIVQTIQTKAPNATIILTGLFPRFDIDASSAIQQINSRLSTLKSVRYLDLTDQLKKPGMLNPDKLHLALPGYQAWADALKPLLREILGPPAAEDQAPPPTGNPGL